MKPHLYTAKTANRAAIAAAVLCATLLLQGCAAVVVGGAAVGGAMVMTDRRTSAAQIDDQTIELKAGSRISEVAKNNIHINVVSYNRTVLVTGEVPTEENKVAIEQALSRIENVQSTVNELAVSPPSSMLGRSNDTLLTSKVKAAFFDAKDLHAQAIKVVTERSTVYLMGRVTEREAARAAQVASEVSGVRKVVRVFDLITEAELAALK